MAVYNSMIIWIAIVAVLYKAIYKNSKIVSVKVNGKIREFEKVPLFIAIITFGYIIFWAGMRTGVGDTAEYIRMFEGTPSSLNAIWSVWNSSSKDPGFDVFNLLFKTLISDNYHYWLMTIALLSGIPVMLTLKKHSINFMYSAFLFVVTLNFFWMFNGIRQFIVVAIGFCISDWIEEGKLFQYMVVVLVLSTIHFTALILIPAYWIARERIFGPKIILIILLLGLVISFVEPFIDAVELILEETTYSGYTEQFANDDGVNPLRVAAMSVTPLLAFVTRKQLRYYNNPYINICVNMSVMSAGLYLLGMFTSGILIGRLPIYFEVYNLILLPYLMSKCFTKDSKMVMYGCCTLGYLAYYYLIMQDWYYISDLTGLLSGR